MNLQKMKQAMILSTDILLPGSIEKIAETQKIIIHEEILQGRI